MPGASRKNGGGGKDPPSEFQQLLALYQAAQARSLHYHNSMRDVASSFFSWFMVLFSASFLAMLNVPLPLKLPVAVPLIWFAGIIAVRGRRVMGQERRLFAYELAVRKKLEIALGWKLKHPDIQPLFGWFRWRAETTAGEFEFYGFDSDEAQAARKQLTLEPNEAREIDKTVEERKGMYGVVARMLRWAWIGARAALFCYFVWMLYEAKVIQFATWPPWQVGEKEKRDTTVTRELGVANENVDREDEAGDGNNPTQ